MGAFLELTTIIGCPNKCVYCPQDVFISKYISNTDKNQLTLDDFKLIVDKLPPNSTLSFAGFSEPFVNQYTSDMICYAFERGHAVWIFTSLIGLSIEQYEKIRKYNYGYFSIHLPDSLGKTIVPITDKYLDTLKHIVTNPPSGTVLYHHHRGEIHDSIKNIVPNSSEMIIQDRAGNLENNEGHILSVKLHLGLITCNHAFLFNSRDGGCLVFPNGDAYLCCNDFGLEHKLGNLFVQSWDEILTSPEMVNIMSGLKDESSNILCRRCASARSVR